MASLEVKIKYNDLEVEFNGPPEQVVKEILKWVSKHIPGFIIATNLFHEPDYIELSELISKYIKTTSDGNIFLLDSAGSLSMHIKILLILSMMKVLNDSGYRNGETASLEELASILVSSQKSVSSRLSELKALGYIDKIKQGKQTRYKVTVRGLLFLMNKLK